jgi:hypothetical protein
MGDIVIDGDLTIGPESSLVIYSPSRVLLEGDRLGAGVDPSRCEINVEGRFEVHSGVIKRWNGFEESTDFEQSKPVVFESLPGQTWTGILPSEAAELRLDEADLRNSDYGLVEPGTKLAALGVHVATVILEEDAPPAAADTFALLTSYPNPFESETTLRYVLAEDSDVRLAIYSSIGQQVRVLVDEYQFAGPQEITWFAAADDGQRVGSGVYLYQLDVPGKFTGRDKMLLLKSGYARLSPIDKALKAHRARWADIRSELDDRLANALEKQPVDDGGIGALLVQLDTIGRSVNEGAGDREQR